MRPGAVTIAVAWCGICGTDLHEFLEVPMFIPSPGHGHPLVAELTAACKEKSVSSGVADHVIDPSEQDVKARVLELTSGTGADDAFEMCRWEAILAAPSPTRGDHGAAIRLVQDGKVDLKPLITGRIALEDLVCKGFHTLINHIDTAVKIIVHP